MIFRVNVPFLPQYFVTMHALGLISCAFYFLFYFFVTLGILELAHLCSLLDVLQLGTIFFKKSNGGIANMQRN